MNTLSVTLAAACTVIPLLAPVARAQQAQPSDPMPGHPGMAMPAPASRATRAPAGTAAAPNPGDMVQSMERMNRDMAGAPMTGNADRDFVAMMTPHHQGAIDMARIYLRDGKDPGLRRMARQIIADQEREIRAFNAWQAKHPG